MDGIRDQLSVMSLPEQLFGDNYLQLTSQLHNLQLSFSSFPALAAWHQEALPPVQVAAAQQWSQSREQDIQAHKPLRFNYDWCGSLSADFGFLLTCPVLFQLINLQLFRAGPSQHLSMEALAVHQPVLIHQAGQTIPHIVVHSACQDRGPLHDNDLLGKSAKEVWLEHPSCNAASADMIAGAWIKPCIT